MSGNPDEIVLKSAEIEGQGRIFSSKERVLRSDTGEIVELRAQSVDVLSVLIDAQEAVVSRSLLIEKVWCGKVVSDDSLSQCISDIRRALDDDTRSVLVTHQRKGYQLVLPDVQYNPRPSRHVLWLVGMLLCLVIIISTIVHLSKPSPETVKTRIAVLAFDDYSPEPDQGYFSDAISDGIITELARFPSFDTIARNSSFAFRGKGKGIREISEALNADVILEGSQQKIGEKLTIVVQLIEAETATHLWAESYEGELSELFEFQADIIRKVASTIGGQLSIYVPRKALRNTVTAMHLHAKGLAELRKGGGAERARPYFAAAIEADSNAAFGYIGMGFYYHNTAGGEPATEKKIQLLEQATAMAEKALEIEPGNSLAHYLMGRILTRSNNLDQASLWFDKAKALNPSSSNVFVGAATEKIYRGRTQEALDDIRYAMSIDPLHPAWFHRQLAWALWQADECEAALASMNRMPKLSVENHKQLAVYQVCVGDIETAKSSMRVYLNEFPHATLAQEIERREGKWTAPGQFERWLNALRVAGLPE